MKINNSKINKLMSNFSFHLILLITIIALVFSVGVAFIFVYVGKGRERKIIVNDAEFVNLTPSKPVNKQLIQIKNISLTKKSLNAKYENRNT